MSGLRSFLVPGEAQKVPLGRTAIVAVFATAIIFLAYSLAKDGVRLPFLSDGTYEVEALFANAAGLRADNEPPVSVAGVQVGKVVDVRFEGGRAHVRMELQRRAHGRIFTDATARVRPLNGANVLSVDILPGRPQRGALPDGRPIPESRTAVPVGSDELLSTLDEDTRASVQVVLAETAAAVEGRGGDLSRALQQTARMTDSAAEVAALVARRRTLTRRLVTDLDRIFTTTGRRRVQLAEILTAGGRLAAVSATNEQQLSRSVVALPGVVGEADAALAAFQQQSTPLRQTLRDLGPAARTLGPALRATRELLPDLRRLVTAGRRFARGARAPLGDLTAAAGKLNTRRQALVSTAGNVTTLFDNLADHSRTLIDVGDWLSGMTSTQDDRSVLGRVRFLGIEPPKPENFGFPAGTSRKALGADLAQALDGRCRRVIPACLLRVLTPGLPGAAQVKTPTIRSGR